MLRNSLWVIVLLCQMTNCCDEEADATYNAAECGYRGVYTCGECLCNPPFFGRRCEFGAPTNNNNEMCKADQDSTVCSGRGSCIFGQCFCDERDNPMEVVSGQYCECTNYDCDRFNGKICGGSDHGNCVCNQCQCKAPWLGTACQHLDDPAKCINTETGEMCSNNGKCHYDECICDYEYAGRWCEICPTCRSPCVRLNECVYCKAFGGNLSCSIAHYEISVQCEDIDVELVTSLPENEGMCSFFDDDDCRYTFSYRYDKSNYKYKTSMREPKECPPPMTPLSLAPGRHECSELSTDGHFEISSKHISELPAGKKIKWTFVPGKNQDIHIYCPFIDISKNPKCREDMLAISQESSHRRAPKICNGTTVFNATIQNGSAKVSFKKTKQSSTFVCTVRCPEKSVIPHECPPKPPMGANKPVTSCADLDEAISGPCSCSECDGSLISIKCSVCKDCDMNIYAAYDFRVPVEFELRSVCSEHLNLTGQFGRNAKMIRFVKTCVEDNIILPYAELINLIGLDYRGCKESEMEFSSCEYSVAMEKYLGFYRSLERSGIHPTARTPSLARIEEFIGTNTTLPYADEVPKLSFLNLASVNLSLTGGVLNYPNLRELTIHSEAGLTIYPNTFVGLTQLIKLTVTTCQDFLDGGSYRLTSNVLRQFNFADNCLHFIAPDAFLLEPKSSPETVFSEGLLISIEANPQFFDHIPICPFRPLFNHQQVELLWKSELNCRSCGGIWYWELHDFENLSASCYDPVSNMSMTLEEYTNLKQKMCNFKTDYSGSCI